MDLKELLKTTTPSSTRPKAFSKEDLLKEKLAVMLAADIIEKILYSSDACFVEQREDGNA